MSVKIWHTRMRSRGSQVAVKAVQNPARPQADPGVSREDDCRPAQRRRARRGNSSVVHAPPSVSVSMQEAVQVDMSRQGRRGKA